MMVRPAARKETSKEKSVRRYSAGGIVFKQTKDGDVLWLIISPKGSNRWQFPKGIIEEGETGKNAAAREVAEEGGVVVQLMAKVGDQSYFYFLEGERIIQHVVFYLMRYIKDTGEGFDMAEIDEVKFLTFQQVMDKLTFDKDKKLLEKAREIAESGVQENLI